MKIKKIIDLSQSPINKDYANPFFPITEFSKCLTYEEHQWEAETITAALHVGTHIDAPLHRFPNGKSIDDYPLERFAGEALIINLLHKKSSEEIIPDDFEPYDNKILKSDNILLITGWGYKRNIKNSKEYIESSPWLGEEAAKYLVGKNINSIGIDHFSIGGLSDRVAETHDILFKADILIFEELMLPKELLTKERWFIVAFPIKLGNTTGSFSRIVAMEFE